MLLVGAAGTGKTNLPHAALNLLRPAGGAHAGVVENLVGEYTGYELPETLRNFANSLNFGQQAD